MAGSNENSGVFFYATFDAPKPGAVDAFKAALGAVPTEGTRKDGSKYVSMHTPLAGWAPQGSGENRIPAWRISADVLGKTRLEDYFSNVRYFASQDDLKAGIETPVQSVAMAAAKAQASSVQRGPAARRAEYYEHMKAYKRDPIGNKGVITAKDVMLFAVKKAKYLAGFTFTPGSKKFTGDIASAVDNDSLFTIGLKGTKAEGINLESVKVMIKKAAADARNALSREEARYGSSLQDTANEIKHSYSLASIERAIGVAVCEAFPPALRAECRDVREQKAIDDRKNGIAQPKEPTQGSLDASAYLSGASAVVTRSAVKSQAGKLFWELARMRDLAPGDVEQRVGADKILNAPSSAFEDKNVFGLLEKQRAVLCAKITETRAQLAQAESEYSARPADYRLVENKILHMNFLDVGNVMGNTHERRVGAQQERERAKIQSLYSVKPGTSERGVLVAVGKEDKDLQEQIKSLGGRWNGSLKAWSVPESNSGRLDLGGRGRIYASVDDMRSGRQMPAASRQAAPESQQELAQSQGSGLSR